MALPLKREDQLVFRATSAEWPASGEKATLADKEDGNAAYVMAYKFVYGSVKISQCVGCTRQFFTKSFLGDDVAALAPSSGEEPASPRHRAGVASMAWRTRTRRKILISTQASRR